MLFHLVLMEHPLTGSGSGSGLLLGAVVQILVDTFILVAPAALYVDLGGYSVIAVGILTFFYTGLLDLAKVFLDPLNNEGFAKSSLNMDLGVLLRESNAGSVRWKDSGSQLPF